MFIYVSLLIFHYTGESRFELEDEEEDEAEMAKTSLTENDDTQNDEEEDEAEMVKTSLTENDDTQNDEEEDEAEMVKTSLTENDESEGAIINIYEEWLMIIIKGLNIFNRYPQVYTLYLK